MYHGYLRTYGEAQNEHYNGPVGGSGGLETVDPCWGEDELQLEFANSVVARINEPPPGAGAPCCGWKVRSGAPREAPQSLDRANLTGLVLGCIDAKFCK